MVPARAYRREEDHGMRGNWGKKAELRRLRREVQERVSEFCHFSEVGVVSLYPDRADKWYLYDSTGKLSFNGVYRSWADFPKAALVALLKADLYPVKPKASLLLLAEEASD
jgi:hypothetical protein